jgi:hypothetical protein
MGVNSTWAGSDQQSGLEFTPILSFSPTDAQLRSSLMPRSSRTRRLVQSECDPGYYACRCPKRITCCILSPREICRCDGSGQPFCSSN